LNRRSGDKEKSFFKKQAKKQKQEKRKPPDLLFSCSRQAAVLDSR
jgi:hypothetical protein